MIDEPNAIYHPMFGWQVLRPVRALAPPGANKPRFSKEERFKPV